MWIEYLFSSPRSRFCGFRSKPYYQLHQRFINSKRVDLKENQKKTMKIILESQDIILNVIFS